MSLSFFINVFGPKLPAGGVDVAAFLMTERGSDAAVHQAMMKGSGLVFFGSLVGEFIDGVVADQIDIAVQSS